MVFCMVTEVKAERATQPKALMVRMSAWIPDSPVASLPVIVRMVPFVMLLSFLRCKGKKKKGNYCM